MCCSVLGGALPLAAQQTLRGTVLTAGSTDSLPFSVVSLEPGFPPRLTDVRGQFTFTMLTTGRYRLVVRQIGHLPFDTLLTVGTAALEPLQVTLQRMAIGLPAVTVRGRIECRVPGPPDPAISAAAAAVFDQAVENARRYRLLADSFPHRTVVERTLATVDAGGNQHVTMIDTLPRESGALRPYRRGHLITDGAGPRIGQLEVRLWHLEDFADSAFIKHHCFRLAGRDTLGGETLTRLDFQPPRSFGEVDVEGAVYLDPATYVVRYAVVRLTQPRQGLRNVAALEARTRFRQIAPWLVVYDHSAVTRLRNPRGASRVEEVRMLDVRFARPLDQQDP